MNQTLELTTLGELDAGRPRQPRAGAARQRPARRPRRPGPRRRHGERRARRSSPTASPAGCASQLPDDAAALRRRARLDRDRGRQPHRLRARRRLGRGLADPRDARADDARRPRARASGVNVECDVLARYVAAHAAEPCHHCRPRGAEPMEPTERDRSAPARSATDRGGDRGHPPRADGRRLRRRGPRERGRPGDGRPVRDPRGGQLHGQARRAA